MPNIKPLDWEPGPEFDDCSWRCTGHYNRKAITDELNGTYHIKRVEIWEVKPPQGLPTIIHKYLT